MSSSAASSSSSSSSTTSRAPSRSSASYESFATLGVPAPLEESPVQQQQCNSVRDIKGKGKKRMITLVEPAATRSSSLASTSTNNDSSSNSARARASTSKLVAPSTSSRTSPVHPAHQPSSKTGPSAPSAAAAAAAAAAAGAARPMLKRGRSQTSYFLPAFLTQQRRSSTSPVSRRPSDGGAGASTSSDKKQRQEGINARLPPTARPSLLKRCGSKSAPSTVDVDPNLQCKSGYRLLSERRDEDGWSINAVTSLRDVL